MIVAFEEDFILNPNYYAFTWRLDVEVARRNARNLFDPRYMVRLDLLSSIQSPFQILDQNQDQELDQNDQNISHVKLHHTESLILIENNGNGSDYVNLRNHVGNDNIKKDENENGNEFSGNDGEFGHQNTVGFKSDVVQSFHSYHLQSDYANMKKMEEEIKMALNSLNVINSQNRVDNNA